MRDLKVRKNSLSACNIIHLVGEDETDKIKYCSERWSIEIWNNGIEIEILCQISVLWTDTYYMFLYLKISFKIIWNSSEQRRGAIEFKKMYRKEESNESEKKLHLSLSLSLFLFFVTITKFQILKAEKSELKQDHF